MVHACRHQRQEERRSEIAGNRPDEYIFGQAGPAEQPDDAAGGIAEKRHDEDDVRHHAENHGEQRREDNVDGFRHDSADRFLHIGNQKCAGNDCQHAALAAAEHRIQRNGAVIQPHNGGDLIDAVQRGDHAQHAAQDGRAAELFRRAIACPRSEEGHHGGVDQPQNLVDKRPGAAFRIVRDRLRNERREAPAESGADDAGKQRDKDISDDSQSAPDPVSFHGFILLYITITILRTAQNSGSRAW